MGRETPGKNESASARCLESSIVSTPRRGKKCSPKGEEGECSSFTELTECVIGPGDRPVGIEITGGRGNRHRHGTLFLFVGGDMAVAKLAS